jgi:hypothetical protein
MKVIIKDILGNYFCKEPEVGLTKIKSDAYIFDCYNEEHSNLILEKTKQFISNNDLNLEVIDKTQINLRIE